MLYRVRVKRTEKGCAVWCPMLPRCWSQGETEAEELENIKDAIRDYIETLEEINPDSEPRFVEVA